MRTLVTGCEGYIGQTLVPILQAAGHQVTGFDSLLYEGCDFPGHPRVRCPLVVKDIRDIERSDLAGVDAILHLAGLSNDPLGDLDPETTYEVNYGASVRLAELAREAGVSRFIFSSSCSNYGQAGDDFLDETAELRPVTPYARSKVLAEEAIRSMADDHFCPVYLRSATAYGLSARLRGDLVVNNLTAYAVTTGEARLKSDGMPWRPLVHIEDISLAFRSVLEAPTEQVWNEAFNVGRTSENYRMREVAELVHRQVPDAQVTFAADAGPDIRNYRVDCDKLPRHLPDFRPRWTVEAGIRQLARAYRAVGMTEDRFFGPTFFRLAHLRDRIANGELDHRLRPVTVSLSPPALP